MTERVQTEAGAVVRLCPGWKGNKWRCGKGEPRVLQGDRELCRACERAEVASGARKSKIEAAQDERHERYLHDLDQLCELVRSRAGSELRVTLAQLDPLLTAIDSITRRERREATTRPPHWTQYDDDQSLAARERWWLLQRLAGREITRKEVDGW